MAFPLNRMFAWIGKVLPLQGLGQAVFIRRLIEARPTFDLFGSEAWEEKKMSLVVGAANDATIESPRVPDGKFWIIDHIHGECSQATPNINVLLFEREPGLARAALAYGSINVNTGVVYTGPSFVLPEKWHLFMISNDTLAVGQTITMRWSYLELPLGEYIYHP